MGLASGRDSPCLFSIIPRPPFRRYSGAELVALIREAALVAMAECECPEAIAPRHIHAASAQISPALNGRPALLAFYERYKRRGACSDDPEALATAYDVCEAAAGCPRGPSGRTWGTAFIGRGRTGIASHI